MEAALSIDWLATGLILGLAAVVLAVAAFVSLSRDRDLSRSAKLMWVAAILLFPVFGSVVYFSVRADW